MAVRELRVAGYRSIRETRLRLGPVNVLVGPNGCGKTNLYRCLSLIAAAAEGRLARAIADEGGMPSALWAGQRGRGPVRMVLAVTVDQFTYELQCGLPQQQGSMFALDPEIKEEHAWFLNDGRRTELLHRAAGTVWARDDEGTRVTFPMALSPSESALSELREPQRFPVLAMLRQEILGWRFYHQFRTDADSPLRRPQPGCRTPVLGPEGRRPGRGAPDHPRDRRPRRPLRGDRSGVPRLDPPHRRAGRRAVRPVSTVPSVPRVPPAIRRPRVVGRYASVPLSAGDATQPATPGITRPERARNQHPPRPDRTSGTFNRPGLAGLATLDHHPLGRPCGPGRPTLRRHADRATKGGRCDNDLRIDELNPWGEDAWHHLKHVPRRNVACRD